MFSRRKKRIGRTLNSSFHGSGGGTTNRKRERLIKKRSGNLYNRKPSSLNLNPIKRLFYIVLFGIFIITIAWFFLHTTFFHIYSFKVINKSDPLEKTIYLNFLKQYKGENLFLLDTDRISADYREAHPELQAFKLRKSFPRTLTLTIEKYEVVANITYITDDFQKKFLINKNGVVSVSDTNDPSLPYVVVDAEKEFEPNTVIIPTDILHYIMGSSSYFKEKFGMNLIHTIYKPAAREVHLRTEKNFLIWLDIGKSYETQLDKLKRALERLDIYNTPLQYIDLRISSQTGQKIIFKRR